MEDCPPPFSSHAGFIKAVPKVPPESKANNINLQVIIHKHMLLPSLFTGSQGRAVAQTMRRFIPGGDDGDGGSGGTSCAPRLRAARAPSAHMWFAFSKAETIIKAADPLLAARMIANIKVCSV